MKFNDIPGATPLDEETLRGLIPNLTTQGELNEFEAKNIADAIRWASSSRKLKKDLLSVSGLILLHKKMFEQTWTWSGQFRTRETNIGVTPHRIQTDLGILLGNVQFWFENKTYQVDEIAIRFHHRLVWIHPFPNGNGRFSRLATDLLLEFNQQKKFKWGQQDLAQATQDRELYLKALRRADRTDDYYELLKFAKSSQEAKT
jgi:Fic-DOC domain mobile mystery protein B